MAEMESNEQKRLRKYSAISLGIVLVTAFVLVQPTMQASYADDDGGSPALGAEAIPAFDDCVLIDLQSQDDFDDGEDEEQPEDSASMVTVRSGSKVLTIHVEKERYSCFLDQGELFVLLDVDIYLQVLENIETREVLNTAALVTTCMKSESVAITIACESYTPPTTPVFVGSDCDNAEEDPHFLSDLNKHPQEMNVVKKNSIVKSIVAQKMVFICQLEEIEPGVFDTFKKVDIVVFTDVYKDINTLEDEARFYEFRCVTLVTDNDDDSEEENGLRDGTVESCQFSQVPT